jgi:hypothetical protein
MPADVPLGRPGGSPPPDPYLEFDCLNTSNSETVWVGFRRDVLDTVPLRLAPEDSQHQDVMTIPQIGQRYGPLIASHLRSELARMLGRLYVKDPPD